MIGGLFILMLVGFYFTLNKLSTLSRDFQNFESQTRLQNQINNFPAATTTPSEADQSAPTADATSEVVIPTSIIFNASSSPVLTPQTNLTVTVENVAKAQDGTITVNVKIFSSEAGSYSAIDAKGLFELVDLNGSNQNPLSATDSFNSIPPQNAVTGSLTFKTDPRNTTVILQIGGGDQIRFYQFDFVKQNYKEMILG